MTQNNLDSWDGFIGSNFLNADDVKDENHAFVCIATEFDTENERPILVLESSGLKAKFSLNVTNANFVKNAGIRSPNAIIGKKLTFKKVLVRNPQTKKEVEGLRINKIE
jgi:hypothetical protein